MELQKSKIKGAVKLSKKLIAQGNLTVVESHRTEKIIFISQRI
jgi:hypothetical protein